MAQVELLLDDSASAVDPHARKECQTDQRGSRKLSSKDIHFQRRGGNGDTKIPPRRKSHEQGGSREPHAVESSLLLTRSGLVVYMSLTRNLQNIVFC